MIPAQPGYAVHFELSRPNSSDPNKRHQRDLEEPVLAWDDNGAPLIAGPEGLTQPDHYATILGERIDRWEVAPSYKGIHVIPGGGWLETTTLDDGTKYTIPVIAWHIDIAGGGTPILCDGEGQVQPRPPWQASNVLDRVLWHRDCSPSWDPAETTGA